MCACVCCKQIICSCMLSTLSQSCRQLCAHVHSCICVVIHMCFCVCMYICTHVSCCCSIMTLSWPPLMHARIHTATFWHITLINLGLRGLSIYICMHTHMHSHAPCHSHNPTHTYIHTYSNIPERISQRLRLLSLHLLSPVKLSQIHSR
jgi:hypothetical protein